MPLKRIVLIIMCTVLAVMVIMMGVMLGKVSPIFEMLLGPGSGPLPSTPPTTQADPTTNTTVDPTTESTHQPSVPPTSEATVPPTSEVTVPPTTEHIHDFSKVKETVKSTCVKQGHTIYECSCGETKLETAVLLPHTFGAGKLIAPTCTEGGYTLRKCSMCSYEEKVDEIEPLGHDYKETETVPVGCEQDGYVESQCQRCQDIKRENVIKATGHTWVTGEVIKPTCTEGGYTLRKCSACDTEEKIEETEPLGHDFTEWAVVEEPAAGVVGKESRECKACQLKEERALELYITAFNTNIGEAFSAIVEVGAKNSAGQEIVVYSYSITDYSRTLTADEDNFAFDAAAGLQVKVPGKETHVIPVGDGKLILDKDGKPTEEEPTSPSTPTESTQPSTAPSEPAESTQPSTAPTESTAGTTPGGQGT